MNAIFENSEELYQKMLEYMSRHYFPAKVSQFAYNELASEEFSRIRLIICKEYDFNEDRYIEENDGVSPFDEIREDIEREVIERIFIDHEYYFMRRRQDSVRVWLTERITATVRNNGNRICSHFMDDDAVTEYPPIVVSNDSNGYNRYGGYEAATLVGVFLREDVLYCLLNGEAGENFEQSIDSIQVEGLFEIFKWLNESGLSAINNEEVLVCVKCGSTDIQEQAWVDANTKAYIGFNGDERDDRWCEECKEHNRLCSMKEFSEKIHEWWGSTSFKEMERITGFRQIDFSPEEGYQDFVDACNNWWNSKSYDEKRIIWKENNE